jgi:hypothetical protein
MTRLGAESHCIAELLPGVIVFGLGLALTVAPLTAAVLRDVDERHAGVASAVNNAVARIAGLVAVAAVGTLVANRFAATLDERARAAPLPADVRGFLRDARDRPLDASMPKRLADDGGRARAVLESASVRSLHAALWAKAGLLFVGGAISAVGITNRQQRP